MYKAKTNRLLKEISGGFGRASSSSSWNRQLRQARLRAAREFHSRLSAELRSFWEELHPQNSTKEWLAGQIKAKVSDLVREYPRLFSVADKLKTALSAGQIYEATVLIAATIFDVRERNLEAKFA